MPFPDHTNDHDLTNHFGSFFRKIKNENCDNLTNTCDHFEFYAKGIPRQYIIKVPALNGRWRTKAYSKFSVKELGIRPHSHMACKIMQR